MRKLFSLLAIALVALCLVGSSSAAKPVNNAGYKIGKQEVSLCIGGRSDTTITFCGTVIKAVGQKTNFWLKVICSNADGSASYSDSQPWDSLSFSPYGTTQYITVSLPPVGYACSTIVWAFPDDYTSVSNTIPFNT